MSRPLNVFERFYLIEVCRGLWVTSTRFFRNLGLHAFHRIGLCRNRKAGVTCQWPEEPRPPARRLRARHRIMKRPDGSPRCVACMMCETICPAHCISIVAEEHPDVRIEKRPKSFDINIGMCVYCGYCVEACPEDAIRMDSYDVRTAAWTRDGLILHLENLTDHRNEDCYGAGIAGSAFSSAPVLASRIGTPPRDRQDPLSHLAGER